ncbi:MAG: dTMP kinase [bacterium]|nr:dTMP kinase [bacterium]
MASRKDSTLSRKKGLFISLEGGEGSGKSTQARLIKQYLVQKGYQVITTIEPGGTEIGNQIRDILLSPSNKKMIPLAELFLYLSSRAQIVQELILPALIQGKAVICDRYADSSVAYQGVGRKLGVDRVERFNYIATTGLAPDLTFFFDIDPTLGLSRRAKSARGRMDRLEKEQLVFHKRVRKGYLALAKKEPHRIKVIPVKRDSSPAEIFQLVKKEIDQLKV